MINEVVHPNGLSLKIHESFTIKQTQSGFLIRSQNANKLRVAPQVEISLQIDQKHPGGIWPHTRHVHDRTIFYREDEDIGGSGGQTYTLYAWESSSVGYLLWREYTQAESPSKPDFSLVWTVIAGTSIKNPYA